MNDSQPEAFDYSQTLYLPRTGFPMRAGLPEREPEILARWQAMNLFRKQREQAAGRPRFILHDGPPYANGNIHIGHALNKILKDFVSRSQQMLGYDSNYVPGWDCHGLPIEWKIEEDYRAKGRAKPDFADPIAINAFRKECRAFAEHWLSAQRTEFKRLGVLGDWDSPYSTMSFDAEAVIVGELMKFARDGQLYRGSKPVLWSVVEKTALAEAEIEYHQVTSDTVVVAFQPSVFGIGGKLIPPDMAPGEADARWDTFRNDYASARILIWTTTPWTIPGNRAISYSPRIDYGLYEVTAAPADNWARIGDKFVIADKLADSVLKSVRAEAFKRLHAVPAAVLADTTCFHPLHGRGYDFDVPLLAGDHVTDDAGTGFVHTAPGHGREDFDIWMANARSLAERGIDTTIPYTVDADGFFTKDAPGFTGRRVIDDKGNKGDANEAVIKALTEVGALVARGRLKHDYPHSWRSKKPVIFRNTPQWFIAMDRPIAKFGNKTLRELALENIRKTQWVPPQGENRITGMIEAKPDWVLSRQRAWGVPIAVFVNRQSGEILRDERVDAAIVSAFRDEGADAWFADGDGSRFLKPFGYAATEWEKINDVMDVWFDSGSTHAFTLEVRNDLKTHRRIDGGNDIVMYLEGSDQHRGWFHSSLLESCGTRGRAPYDVVLTHGFVLDEAGNKMSKSSRNGVSPQDAIKDSGADILRLWVAASDYANDITLSTDIMKSFADLYRKLRNTLRWMLGTLAHHTPSESAAFSQMPELERLMLHRLALLDGEIRKAYAAYDYNKVVAALAQFMTADLSAFYFDVRKDALYCDPRSSLRRRAALATIERIFRAVTVWLAPILCFTTEEAWRDRYGDAAGSVHLELFPEVPENWRDEALDAKWRGVRNVRRVVTGALEIERAAKRIGSSLEAAPIVHIADPALKAALAGVDFAEICITSGIEIAEGDGPADAFRMDEVRGVAVVPRRAEGRKCARSWKYFDAATADPAYPDITPRDARAMREWQAGRA